MGNVFLLQETNVAIRQSEGVGCNCAGGAPQGAAVRLPNLSIGGGGGGGGASLPPPPPPPNFRLQYKGVLKSPLLSLFCNRVYWLKPHNNVNSRPPNLAVLPPPC